MNAMNNKTVKRTAKRRKQALKRGRPVKLGPIEIILCRLAGQRAADAH